MDRLSGRNVCLVGLTLFSMFFGAGNLIFPPFLGAAAGTNTWTAMAGFSVTAIGFPILGVIAVAKSGGLTRLAGRVHPLFASVFTLLIYLSIGPCLAIPRTAGTSFEMAALPFLSGAVPEGTARVIYSCIFFLIAFLVALKPERLTERLGKVLTPCLLSLIAVIFVGCVVKPAGGYGAPAGAYASGAAVRGFLEGYQTMDTIAALNFGIIISLNIRAMGVKEESSVVREMVKAGGIAGIILFLVYAALAHIGAVTGGSFGAASNGARTLNEIVRFLFGKWGMVLLAAVFFIACLNTCIGLISCCGRYFQTIFPKLSYPAWAFLFAAASLVISNAGLDQILNLSVPVLNGIYPAAIMLILLSFFFEDGKRWKSVYVLTIVFTGITSVLLAAEQAGAVFLHGLLEGLPFYEWGLGWLVPAGVGVAVGMAVKLLVKEREK